MHLHPQVQPVEQLEALLYYRQPGEVRISEAVPSPQPYAPLQPEPSGTPASNRPPWTIPRDGGILSDQPALRITSPNSIPLLLLLLPGVLLRLAPHPLRYLLSVLLQERGISHPSHRPPPSHTKTDYRSEVELLIIPYLVPRQRLTRSSSTNLESTIMKTTTLHWQMIMRVLPLIRRITTTAILTITALAIWRLPGLHLVALALRL